MPRSSTGRFTCCVVLWGFTAILGKLISLGTLALVWWRMVLVAGALALVPRFWRGLRRMPPRLIAIYAGIGMVVALHWLTFYGSVRLANASVAATCMALTPVFLAFVEPFLVGRRFDMRELLFGAGRDSRRGAGRRRNAERACAWALPSARYRRDAAWPCSPA